MKEEISGLIENIQFLSKLLRWREYWTVILVSLSIFGFWIIFCLTFYLPSPWNAIAMWGIIIGLALASPKR
jgi:hydrogenase/urease accessory protein HupE